MCSCRVLVMSMLLVENEAQNTKAAGHLLPRRPVTARFDSLRSLSHTASRIEAGGGTGRFPKMFDGGCQAEAPESDDPPSRDVSSLGLQPSLACQPKLTCVGKVSEG